MKDKRIAIIQKQIIMEIIIWWLESCKNFKANLKRLVEWFWRVLAQVRLSESRRISKSAI